MKQCGCIDSSLPGQELYPQSRYCTSDSDIREKCRESSDDDCVSALYKVYNRVQCVRKASMHLMQSLSAMGSCGCYPPCHESSSDISYSFSYGQLRSSMEWKHTLTYLKLKDIQGDSLMQRINKNVSFMLNIFILQIGKRL